MSELPRYRSYRDAERSLDSCELLEMAVSREDLAQLATGGLTLRLSGEPTVGRPFVLVAQRGVPPYSLRALAAAVGSEAALGGGHFVRFEARGWLAESYVDEPEMRANHLCEAPVRSGAAAPSFYLVAGNWSAAFRPIAFGSDGALGRLVASAGHIAGGELCCVSSSGMAHVGITGWCPDGDAVRVRFRPGQRGRLTQLLDLVLREVPGVWVSRGRLHAGQ